MAAIVESLDMARRPEHVFAYATDFAHFPEWQLGVASARREDQVSLGVGSRGVVARRAGPRTMARSEEITELDPPRTWAVRGVGGLLIAIAKGTSPSPTASARASRSRSSSRRTGSAGCCSRSSAVRRESSSRRTRNS